MLLDQRRELTRRYIEILLKNEIIDVLKIFHGVLGPGLEFLELRSGSTTSSFVLSMVYWSEAILSFSVVCRLTVSWIRPLPSGPVADAD